MRALTAWLPLGSLLLGLAMVAPAFGQATQLVAASPPADSTLRVGEALYVRLQYEADQPLRFRVRGYQRGQEHGSPARSNPAPPYPAGRGEAIAWLEYTRPAILDEIVIETYDADWVLLYRQPVPFYIEWLADAPAMTLARPPWVDGLNKAQQQMTRDALAAGHAGDDDGLWMVIFMLAGWSIPGYFILQVVLYRRWHDQWRRLALLPLWIAVPVTAYTLFALLRGSNLWPLVMLFTLPFAFLYLLVLVLARRVFAAA